MTEQKIAVIRTRASFIGKSACLRHASVDGPGFESRCSLLTTGPLYHRCAPTCLKTESKLAQ